MKLHLAVLTVFTSIAFSGNAAAATGDEIIAAQNCNKCHTATTTKKGPSYASVAARYRGKPDAATTLFNGLKAGGKVGEEDDHKKVEGSDDDIKAVVATVLATK